MQTQKSINQLAYQIIGCAIEVHKEIGPGLLESIYEECLHAELKRSGLNVEKQIGLKINYKGEVLAKKFRIDLMVKNTIVLELKSVEHILPVFKAQLLSYMKLASKPKGILINFHTDNISKNAIHMVNEHFAKLPDA